MKDISYKNQFTHFALLKNSSLFKKFINSVEQDLRYVPTREYLHKTVTQVLYEGLAILAKVINHFNRHADQNQNLRNALLIPPVPASGSGISWFRIKITKMENRLSFVNSPILKYCFHFLIHIYLHYFQETHTHTYSECGYKNNSFLLSYPLNI